MKRTAITAGALALLTSSLALGDHHGRGAEQVNGFPGVYVHPQITMTFTGDGYLITTVNASNVTAGVQTYTVADGILTVQDVSPPAFYSQDMADCVRDNPATYQINDLPDGFSMTAIDEPCPPRAGLLTRFELRDYVRPAE
ncbi:MULTISPECIES: hypothetical protein [Hyphobacterium]|uniref:Uncharacterized protein n=1 Tax=Hyphobacterium vulgare TaxID=1736751 RepID=A0ABV6ZZ93_9PROT